ncbi:MAG TPA: class II aldolase [Clostridiales bacterium]|nr:class II aldolase [Clostridiales bacterium]
MSANEFITCNQSRLSEYTRMSRTAGSRSDYVQGGGGNTSVKFDAQLMAIKASGYRLDQIAPDQAYAVLDFAAIRKFYENTDPATLADVEAAGSAQAKAATLPVEGLPALRPSVEAGFHSLLDTFVLHTHPIYANLATCSTEGAAIAGQALADIGAGFTFVPYINPGAQLTFSIGQARRNAIQPDGTLPAIIFMQNHGLIVTGPDADTCLALHDEVNQRIAAAFGVSSEDWPNPALAESQPMPGFMSATRWLREKLLKTDWQLEDFTTKALYPDQLVFLSGQVAVANKGSLEQALSSGLMLNDKCTVFRETGEVFYQCARTEAQTIEETLCAILFITGTIRQANRTVVTMNEAGKDFISNWESEKYRKSIAAK